MFPHTFLHYLQSPTQSQEEANSPSDVKEEDEGSEDESDDRIDQAAYDPERLKAFNVRLFGKTKARVQYF
jgi:hypothetical protein